MSMTEAKLEELFGTAFFPSRDAMLSLTHIDFAGNPTTNIVPTHVGQICHNTNLDDWYIAHGLTNVDWKIFAT